MITFRNMLTINQDNYEDADKVAYVSNISC